MAQQYGPPEYGPPEQYGSREREPQDQRQSDDAVSPVPNRRERRGGKAGAPTTLGSKGAAGRRTAPVVPPRQYSTRRRSG